jgi:SAM-dependent methyltransferase
MVKTEPIGTETRATCLLCAREGEVLYRDLPDRLFGASGDWSFRQCEDCGLLWLDPAPTAEEIHKAYANYYTHDHGGPSRIEQLVAPIVYGLLGLSRERSQLARTINLADLPPGRVLEIGFGAGRRLEDLIKRGWEAEGQEIDPLAIRGARGRGITVHEGPLDECRLPSGSYDAIVGTHVIEHVHNPLKVLRTCYDLLAPGGTLVLVTPNARSIGHQIYGDSWRGLEPPRHLHIFSRQSLEISLHRAGFSGPNVSATMAHTVAIVSASRILSDRRSPGTPLLALQQAGSVARDVVRARLRHREDGEELVVVARRSPDGSPPDD